MLASLLAATTIDAQVSVAFTVAPRVGPDPAQPTVAVGLTGRARVLELGEYLRLGASAVLLVSSTDRFSGDVRRGFRSNKTGGAAVEVQQQLSRRDTGPYMRVGAGVFADREGPTGRLGFLGGIGYEAPGQPWTVEVGALTSRCARDQLERRCAYVPVSLGWRF